MDYLRRYKGLFFSLLLVLASASAIVYFSGQSGVESQGLSKGIASWLLEHINPNYSEKTLNFINFLLRRGAHLTLYFLLGCGLEGALQWQKRVPSVAASIIIGVLFASWDEYHQLFSGGRSGRADDVLLDSCGIVSGCITAYLIEKNRHTH